MMTLRRGLDMMQSSSDRVPETPNVQPAVQPHHKTKFAGSGGLLRHGAASGSGKTSQRNSLIRRPAPIYVDADTDK
jgi:hypothetical protein